VRGSSLLVAIGVIVLAKRGQVRLAAHMLVWLCLCAVWSVILVLEYPDPTLGRSAHVWFVAVLIGTYFVLLDSSSWTRALYATLCIASFMLVALGSHAIPALAPVPHAVGRWAFPATIVAALATSILLLQLFVADIVEAEARLDRANARLEDLLENMLPRSVAQRLRQEGKTFADGYSQCSILFADIVGFTALSERLPPEAVVAKLNAIFSRFDELRRFRVRRVGERAFDVDVVLSDGARSGPVLAEFEAAIRAALPVRDLVLRMRPVARIERAASGKLRYFEDAR